MPVTASLRTGLGAVSSGHHAPEIVFALTSIKQAISDKRAGLRIASLSAAGLFHCDDSSAHGSETANQFFDPTWNARCQTCPLLSVLHLQTVLVAPNGSPCSYLAFSYLFKTQSGSRVCQDLSFDSHRSLLRDTVGLGVSRSQYSVILCIRIHQPALSYAG